jgi:hypothetical protein
MGSAMRVPSLGLALVLLSGPAFADKTSPLLKAAIGINARYAQRHTKAMMGVGLPKSVVESPGKLIKQAKKLAEGATTYSIGGEAASTAFYANKQAIELAPSVVGMTLYRKDGHGFSSQIVGGTVIDVNTDRTTGKANKVSISNYDRRLERELSFKDGAWHVTSEQRGGRTLSYKIVDGKVVR